MNETPSVESTSDIGGEIGQEKFLERLRKALNQDGDFPTSAKIVAELKALANSPHTTASQVAEVILREPSLGARVLHVVNSSFYHRGKPIMTITQAVIRIGMKPLAELCAGLVLLQKFGSVARRGHAFSQVLSQTVVTSLLSSSLTKKISEKSATVESDESGYLAGSLSEMGPLLMAYYFPEVYENATKRSEQKRQTISQSISEIVGMSPIEISIEVVSALNLPQYYKDVLKAAMDPTPISKESNDTNKEESIVLRAGAALSSAQTISESVLSGKGKNSVDVALAKAQGTLGIQISEVHEVLGELSESFSRLCDSVDLHIPPLPQFLSAYADAATASGPEEVGEDKFMQFVDEIRQSVENREPSAAVITTVMETLTFGMGFDRVLLLLAQPGKRALSGRMGLGSVHDLDPRSIQRSLIDDVLDTPDAKAFHEGRPVFLGDPILSDGWPFAAIPVGFGARAIGVVYCDRTAEGAEDLTSQEQAAIVVLAELLDRSLNQKG